MFNYQIPLWINLTDVQVDFKLTISERFDDHKEPPQLIETTDKFIYKLSGTGELSRIIEIISDNEKDTNNVQYGRYSHVTVYVSATNPAQKYKGEFFCVTKEAWETNPDIKPQLCLSLNVPETSLKKFCDALISRKISGLKVGICVEATQDDDVGCFGPPSRDDAAYIKANNDLVDCKVKLTEITSIISC